MAIKRIFFISLIMLLSLPAAHAARYRDNRKKTCRHGKDGG